MYMSEGVMTYPWSDTRYAIQYTSKSDHGYVITPSDIYMERRYSLKGRMIF